MREFFPFGLPFVTYPFGLFPFAGVGTVIARPVVHVGHTFGDAVTLDRAVGDADIVQGGGTRTVAFDKGTN